MKFIVLGLVILAYIKSFYYSLYEIKQKQNKSGGITYVIFATIGLISSFFIILFMY